MKKIPATLLLLTGLTTLLVSFSHHSRDSLRDIYSRPASQWPQPHITAGVEWTELGILPPSPVADVDSLAALQQLGAVLFFDGRLSGSGKISCATCHSPELSWTDGREKSQGQEGALTKRNSPTIQNVWFYQKLFWDGRSGSLEDQAFSPINAESEMHGDMPGLPRRLRKIAGYAPLFKAAFGDSDIDPDRITIALAAFQRTITSGESAFDRFLKGERKAMSKPALRGLHLFRTKARCINCHHGSLFTDNLFHNNGLSGTDIGHFFVTHKEADKGKFKTPSLRDVARTGPWMHDGSVSDLRRVILHYNQVSGAPADSLLQPAGLNDREVDDLLAFLRAISAPPKPFSQPQLPE